LTTNPGFWALLVAALSSGKSAAAQHFIDLASGRRRPLPVRWVWLSQANRRWPRYRAFSGAQVCRPMAGFNRAALRNRILLMLPSWLEALLHPLIGAEIVQYLARAESPYAILVWLLLVESGQYRLTQRILVDAPEHLQIARTIARPESERTGVSHSRPRPVAKNA
jgi:dephospho-CoA kinase